MSQVPYLSAVGSLQYLVMMTRPDIAHSVAYLTRFNSHPGPEHWKVLKHLFWVPSTTNSLTKAIWPTLSLSSPTLMPLMVIVLIPDALLLDM
jgi:hypothetical protein